jgi:hypothetical protein
MATFMDGNENEVDHQKRARTPSRLNQKEAAEDTGEYQDYVRNGLPIVFERFEDREPLRPCVGQVHGLLFPSQNGAANCGYCAAVPQGCGSPTILAPANEPFSRAIGGMHREVHEAGA